MKETTAMKAILIIDFLKTFLVKSALSLHEALKAYLPVLMIAPLMRIAKKEMILKLSTKANSALETNSESFGYSDMVWFLPSMDYFLISALEIHFSDHFIAFSPY